MKNEILNELLAENRRNLRDLHNRFGFDFNKPISVMKRDGRFTAKSLVDALRLYCGADAKECRVVVLMTARWSGLYCAKLVFKNGAPAFDIEVDDGFTHFNKFWSKSYFEEERKSGARTAYIIAQKFDYLLPVKNWRESFKPDPAARYVVNRDTRYNEYKVMEISTGRKYTYQTARNAEMPFDKSGYYVAAARADLKSRAKELRDKRAHEDFVALDTSALVIAIDAAVVAAKSRLSLMFSNSNSYEDYKRFRNAFNNGWHSFLDTIDDAERFKRSVSEKSYGSIDQCMRSFNAIIAHLAACGSN